MQSPPLSQIESHFHASLQDLFTRANKSASGEISGQEALAFFPSLNLPKAFLKTLWSQTVPPNASTMNYQQFEQAMRLIYQFQTKQQGAGVMQPQQSQAQARPRTNSHGVPPVAPPMTQQDRQKYEGFFQKVQKNSTVPYKEGIAFFMNSGLDQQILNGVWQQFDNNRKGFLTKDEFCSAMHAVMMRKRGIGAPPPQQVPPPTTGGMGSAPTPLMPQTMQPMRGPAPGGIMGANQMGGSGGIMPAPMMPPSGGGMMGMGGAPGVNVHQMEARVSRLQDEAKSLGTQRFEAERDNSRLTIKLQEMQGREESLQETIQKQRAEIQRLLMERDQHQAQLQQVGQNIEQFQMERQQLLNQLTNVKQETFRLESFLNNAKMQQDRAKSETQQVVNEIGIGSNRLKNLKDQIEALQRDIDSKQREQSDSEREESARLRELEDMQRKLQDLRVTNDDISSRILEFDTKKRVFTEVSNKVAEQIKMFEMKKSELERRLKECQEKVKTYEVQNEKTQCVRLAHLTQTAENILQNINDILDNRTTQINIVPLEEVAPLNDFQMSVPTSRMSRKPTEDFGSFSSAPSIAPPPKTSSASFVATEKPQSNGSSNAAQDNLFDDDFGSSAAPKSINGASSQAAPSGGAMDDLFGDMSATPATKMTAPSNGGASKAADGLFDDDFFGDSAPAKPTTSSAPVQQAKAAPAQSGFDDDEWADDEDFGF